MIPRPFAGHTSLAATALVLFGCSCDEGSATSVTTSGAGGGGVTVGSSSSTVMATSGSGGAGVADWTEVPWGHPCDTPVWFSADPKDDVPIQRWVPCEAAVAGCEKWDVYWQSTFPFIVLTSVLKQARGYVFGVLAFWSSDEGRAVLYDSDQAPRFAWRSKLSCATVGPHAVDGGTWFGAQHGFATSTYVFYREGAFDVPEPVTTTASSQRQTGSASLLTLETVGANTLVVWDHQTKQAHVHTTPPGVENHLGVPVGNDVVLHLHFPTFPEPKGWIWQRSTGQFGALIAPPSKAVVDLRGDTSTLVWIETDPPAVNASMWPPGTLYTSPYATTPADVVPTTLRAVPSFGNASTMSEGYYAMTSAPDEHIHIYRLNDGRHWSFAVPAEAFYPRDVAFVDSTYVFYNSPVGVFRQAIAALGPGD